jgi:hypothetical protein
MFSRSAGVMATDVKVKLQMADQGPLSSYLARRAVSPQWRPFLRAVMAVMDEHLPAEGRVTLLRALGAGMAREMALPACTSLGELEARMNEALAAVEWGYVQISLDETVPALLIQHAAAPLVSVAGDAEGAWLGTLLEGLHQAWLDAQPGAAAGVPVRCARLENALVELRYALAA